MRDQLRLNGKARCMACTAHGYSVGFHPLGLSNVPPRLTPAERRRIEAIVESLIDILDENDGDPDPEPSLG
jgi:hypothetical protein